jgi:predicted CoA-binding protein
VKEESSKYYEGTSRDFMDFFNGIKKIAIVGSRDNPDSHGFRTAVLLRSNGYEVYFIEPGGKDRLGVKFLSSVSDLPDDIDVIDCYVEEEDVTACLREVLKKRVSTIWLEPQLKSLPAEAESILKESGVNVIRNLSLHGEFLSSFTCGCQVGAFGGKFPG